ncbi:MAG: MBL fold metallo-hydrolase [Sulfuritalea sp.]|nr:MBL fold metallo-hydrolase [Sulfuritalea sp.]
MGPHAREISSEVFQVGGQGLTAPEDAAIYLLTVGAEAALIDAGCGRATDLLLANIEAAGVAPASIRWLLLTHCHFDHTGGAEEVRRRLGCITVAHELDATFVESGDAEVSAACWYDSRLTPCPIDRKLRGERESLLLGTSTIEALHIPGHSPGSVAYVFESGGRRILFGQDVHGPLAASLRSNAAHYQQSLQTLLAQQADILCEGHYGIFQGRSEVAAFIRRFVET